MSFASLSDVESKLHKIEVPRERARERDLVELVIVISQ